jgi:hypothetical protein
VLEKELNALYDEVQEDFSKFYRALNDDDEGKFTAKLTPSEGKLEFDVNFYERGLFPPGAFHSDGHQDGMGVCRLAASSRIGPQATLRASQRTVDKEANWLPAPPEAAFGLIMRAYSPRAEATSGEWGPRTREAS